MTLRTEQLETCDFRKPRGMAAVSRRTFDHWISACTTLVAERWGRLNLDVSIAHIDTQTLSLNAALESFPDPGLGIQAAIGAKSLISLNVARPGGLRQLAHSLLGPAPSAETLDSPLTAIEESMLELLFQEFLSAVGDAWPGAEPLEVRLMGIVPRPRRTRLYPLRTTLTVVTLHIESTSGSGDLLWAMPQTEIEDLIEIECTPPDEPRVTPSLEMPRLICSASVPLTVELGRMTLSMTELSSLQTGDVVVLDQPLASALVARIGGAVKFLGRPGRLGSHRCLEIEKVFDGQTLEPSES